MITGSIKNKINAVWQDFYNENMAQTYGTESNNSNSACTPSNSNNSTPTQSIHQHSYYDTCFIFFI